MPQTLLPINAFEGEYEFLSNFSEHDVIFRGVAFKTNEHAFQYAKATDYKEAQNIRNAPTPGKAKRLGRTCQLIDGWDSMKDDVMLEIVRAKFDQHPQLATLLLATGDRPLIEGNWWGDKYWGVCNGIGKNKLGKILERVRDEIRARS